VLSLWGARHRLCDGLTRRELLRVGGLGLLGLSLPDLLRGRAAASPSRARRPAGRAKSCILLFMVGGPPQYETWDPKPDAPSAIRGEFRLIATSVPGLQVCELMPQVARLADRYCVLRAVSTGINAHSSSGYWMLTGHEHPRGDVEVAGQVSPTDAPSLGAVVRRLTPPTPGLPAAVTLPEPVINNPHDPWPGQNAGFLGRAWDPWLLPCDPSAADFRVPEVSLPDDMPALRLDGRRRLVDQVNRHLDGLDRHQVVARHGGFARQAFDVLLRDRARRAFALHEEPAAVRDRYGRYKFGQSCLLARRLVEAGVSLVQVNWPREPGDTSSGNPCWDTHQKNTERLKTALMPPMDRGYSALLEDLAQRGLLDETLVVWAGEFGRTPKINAEGGRDHWGLVFSVAVAGGGILGGQVYGASDRIGASPKDGLVRPQDLTATVFHCLGLAPETEIHDAFGRPYPISRGEVLRQLF
jgi:hypothetical protein